MKSVNVDCEMDEILKETTPEGKDTSNTGTPKTPNVQETLLSLL